MDLQARIIEILKSQFQFQNHDSLSPAEARKVAEAVQRLSDFYIEFPESPTPWHESWCQLAYLGYYLPLNSARAERVIQKGNEVDFFNGLNQLIDFGSGLGSASLSLANIPQHFYIERSIQAQQLHQKLGARGEWLKASNENSFQKITTAGSLATTLAIFSYSLTEITELPAWAEKCEALMLIEPATKQDGRRLLELREKLIVSGFYAWAPCLHQENCPLLHQSKHDWCHDRVHFERPTWFQAVEKHLPMKNQTLTCSYLLLRKTLAPVPAKKQVRLVGDQLFEKGKSRILVCRGPEREYLTWMQRHWPTPPAVQRGDLLDWPEHSEIKANEIRVIDNKF